MGKAARFHSFLRKFRGRLECFLHLDNELLLHRAHISISQLQSTTAE